MIRSMTGFGSARAKSGDEEVTVDIRSVNQKYCEVKARLPSELAPAEHELVKQIKLRLHRGAVDVYVKRSSLGPSTLVPKVDISLAQEYARLFESLGQALSLDGKVPLQSVLEAEGVLRVEPRAVDMELVGRVLAEATVRALDQLVKMREREGKSLAADLLAHASLMRDHAALISEAAPRMTESYRDRLAIRAKDLAQGFRSILPASPRRWRSSPTAATSPRSSVAWPRTSITSRSW